MQVSCSYSYFSVLLYANYYFKKYMLCEAANCTCNRCSLSFDAFGHQFYGHNYCYNNFILWALVGVTYTKIEDIATYLQIPVQQTLLTAATALRGMADMGCSSTIKHSADVLLMISNHTTCTYSPGIVILPKLPL